MTIAQRTYPSTLRRYLNQLYYFLFTCHRRTLPRHYPSYTRLDRLYHDYTKYTGLHLFLSDFSTTVSWLHRFCQAIF